MTSPFSVFMPFQSYLSALKSFKYTPNTNWDDIFSDWFSFSPTVNFGSNVQDVGVERHVLSRVGSYGKQLHRVIDALTVVLSSVDRDKLTPEERRKIADFEDMARDAASAVAEYKGRQPDHGITQSDVDHMIDQLLALKKTEPKAFKTLSEQITTRLEGS